MSRKELGRQGEELAAELLRKKGYIILARNLAVPQGEVDLLAEDGQTVVLVEVKTQASARYSHPVFKVDAAKQRKLRLLARLLAARYPDRLLRVDVVTVYWEAGKEEPVMEHLINVLS